MVAQNLCDLQNVILCHRKSLRVVLPHRTELRDPRVFTLAPFDGITAFDRHKQKEDKRMNTTQSLVCAISTRNTFRRGVCITK